MAEELFDIFDEHGKKIGIKTRKQAHEKGLWHQASHVWFYNSKGNILLQKRCKTKESHPGLFDISAAGHCELGQTPLKTAVREVKEELGLKLNKKNIKKIGIIKKSSVPKKGYNNNEFDHIYIYRFDEPISKIKFLDGEVEKVIFIPIKKFEKEIKDKKTSKKYVPHGDYYYNYVIDAIKKELRKIK